MLYEISISYIVNRCDAFSITPCKRAGIKGLQ